MADVLVILGVAVIAAGVSVRLFDSWVVAVIVVGFGLVCAGASEALGEPK